MFTFDYCLQILEWAQLGTFPVTGNLYYWHMNVPKDCIYQVPIHGTPNVCIKCPSNKDLKELSGFSRFMIAPKDSWDCSEKNIVLHGGFIEMGGRAMKSITTAKIVAMIHDRCNVWVLTELNQVYCCRIGDMEDGFASLLKYIALDIHEHELCFLSGYDADKLMADPFLYDWAITKDLRENELRFWGPHLRKTTDILTERFKDFDYYRSVSKRFVDFLFDNNTYGWDCRDEHIIAYGLDNYTVTVTAPIVHMRKNAPPVITMTDANNHDFTVELNEMEPSYKALCCYIAANDKIV